MDLWTWRGGYRPVGDGRRAPRVGPRMGSSVQPPRRDGGA